MRQRSLAAPLIPVSSVVPTAVPRDAQRPRGPVGLTPSIRTSAVKTVKG